MRTESIAIADNGEKYIWLRDDKSCVEIDHGEILKDLLYIGKNIFEQAYKELISRLQYEYDADQIDMSTAEEAVLRSYVKMIPVSAEDKLNYDIFDFEEAEYLAGTILGYRINDDIRAVIENDHLEFLYKLITFDLYNTALYCRDILQFQDYLPDLFHIKGYNNKIKKLLLQRICSPDLEQYCTAGRLEVGFSVENDIDIFHICSLDQFIRLEIRNIMSKKSSNPQFCECEVCKRLFTRRGSGSYKKVRCSYPYKTPCDTIKPVKSEIEKYKKRIANRINKHNERNNILIKKQIDAVGLAYAKIDSLLKEEKMTHQEIISYMDKTWWPTVRKYDPKKDGDLSRI